MQWKASLSFETNLLSSPFLQRQFSFIYEASTKTGIPGNLKFEAEDFVRPGLIAVQILVTNLDMDSAGIIASCWHNTVNMASTIENGSNKHTITWKVVVDVQEPL